jgi:hypothetical protein
MRAAISWTNAGDVDRILAVRLPWRRQRFWLRLQRCIVVGFSWICSIRSENLTMVILRSQIDRTTVRGDAAALGRNRSLSPNLMGDRRDGRSGAHLGIRYSVIGAANAGDDHAHDSVGGVVAGVLGAEFCHRQFLVLATLDKNPPNALLWGMADLGGL